MVIIKEKQNLDEMARVCQKSDGYGIVVEIYSRDHGKVGDRQSPAHAHLLDTNLKELGEFVLLPGLPRKASDIIWYRTDNPPEGYASRIVKWARGISKFRLNNWAFALQVWIAFHPN